MSGGQALALGLGLLFIFTRIVAGEGREAVIVVLISLVAVAVFELVRSTIRNVRRRSAHAGRPRPSHPGAGELSDYGDVTGSQQHYPRLRPGTRIWRAFRRRHESQEDRYRHAAQDLQQFRADVAREGDRRRANHWYRSD